MRATTLIDYERLALDVPGAPIARARAWAGLDPGLPGLKATGTVVVVIVPWLPAKQPMASPALLETVLRHLDRSRLVGTRLIVAGPRYLVVTVRATLVVTAGARSERVLEDVRVALCSFLDPLNGGQNERGWPFGRDVYRSEILGVIDNVTGVDHVEKLELVGDANAPQCANLCVGPLMLVTPGKHVIEVAKKPAREGEPYVCT
jgi:predicted phage baseplate assembly protein